MKTANLALRFLLELCALAALAYWGFVAGGSLLLSLLLGIGAPLLAAVIWGIWVAPASRNRLPMPQRLVPEVIVFGAAAVALVAAGQPILALAFALVSIANRVLVEVWEE